ncbi:uncharacterized protein N7482_001772 [Penicillium canariense]|uniref:Uncharacterized protein n=1 Tax=Penicillium canariense TaxID=189055 RepID=A0A9W9LTV9_9EURO|nr:uncharacterized protein N7482_001772 [Penicillium canariense]KAJ5175895.1 hypothetical protein N7482_001772 [Penicillium canariense]
MQFTVLIPVLLSALSLTSALPDGQASTWNCTNFELNCSPGGCAYRFNISAPQSENAPGFSTYCEGLTPNATACANDTITAAVSPLTNPKWNVKVQHEWHVIEEEYNSEATYWQAGSANVTETTTAFLITPNVFYGVA